MTLTPRIKDQNLTLSSCSGLSLEEDGLRVAVGEYKEDMF